MTNPADARWLKLENIATTLLRVAVGVIFVVHGALKVGDIAQTTQNFAQMGIPMPEIAVYLAVLGELVGGLGLLIGLFTRVAALGPLCVMVVAILFVHLGKGLLAQSGGWEYPLTLLLVSLFFVAHGAGPFSVDEMLRRQKGERLAQPARRQAPVGS